MDTLDTPLDPKNANRYAYAGDDPINNVDPLGRFSCATSLKLAGLALAGVTLGIGLLAVEGGGAPETLGGSLIPLAATVEATISAIGLLAAEVEAVENCF